jgi:hypothetical protein
MAHAEAVAHDQKDDNFWAFNELIELIEAEPETAWPIILEIIKNASDDATLAYVAAGPLEDLICEHPHLVIQRVELCATRDARFRKTLAGVLGSNRMPKEIRARLDALVANEPSL